MYTFIMLLIRSLKTLLTIHWKVDSSVSGEGSIIFIWGIHLDLVLSKVGIHEVEEFVTHCRIDHLVMLGSEELSLWQSLFKSVKSI